MSSHDAMFQVYYNGKFEISEDNITTYVGGEVHTLISSPQAMFTNLMESLSMSLIGQRIWYKLPFEDVSELKLLCNGNGTFKRMCEAVLWTKAADVFMELEDPNDGAIGDVIENRDDIPDNRADGDDNTTAGVTDVANDGRAEVDGVEENRGNGNDEMVEEDEHDNYEDTPPNSDCEDGEDQRQYVGCKKGSGDIRLGQVFDSISEFKQAVIEYALKEGYNVKFTRWGSEKSEVRCSLGGCNFRIYCAIEKPIQRFMVKTFDDHHTCMKDGFSKVVKDGIIAKLLLNDIRKDPTYKPKAIQDAIEEKYNLTVSNDQCRKAKRKALTMIQDEQDEQFARLKDYKLQLIESNPNSTVEVGTVTNDGIETFDRFYVCFEVLRKTWIAYCRPIIGIDGCFLKNNVKGQLLTAVGRDANNQFFPVAWAIVKVENEDNWLWFIKKLKHDLKIHDGNGFTLISDRQKGLINAVEQELPKVEHRMCARHIYGNLRRVYRGKDLPKALFWAVAKSFNTGEYNRAIEALKKFDLGVYEEVMKRNPENCSRAFFTYNSVCEDVSNNFSESYNNSINKAREMPLVEMLETIRRQAMIHMDTRKNKAIKHQGKYTLKVAMTIKEEEKHRKNCRVIPSGNGQYEVNENGNGYTVDMLAKTCACRRWNMTGIPCRHVLRVILYRKLDPQDYVSDWYLTEKWRKQYSDPIRAVNGIDLWKISGESRIQPPAREETQGPKKKHKRIKGKNESPKKKKKGNVVEEPPAKIIKITREGRTFHCGGCGAAGHNIRRCPVTVYTKKQPSDVIESDHGEGPSQSQPSQNEHVD